MELNSITLADGQSTPVEHSFKPDGEKNGLFTFADRSGGIPIGFPKLQAALTDTSGPQGKSVLFLKIKAPTLEVTSPSTTTGIQPAPTVAYSTAVTMSFELPHRSALQNRKDNLAYAKGLLDEEFVQAAVHDLEKFYV